MENPKSILNIQLLTLIDAALIMCILVIGYCVAPEIWDGLKAAGIVK